MPLIGKGKTVYIVTEQDFKKDTTLCGQSVDIIIVPSKLSDRFKESKHYLALLGCLNLDGEIFFCNA
jgi:hypothetical protein